MRRLGLAAALVLLAALLLLTFARHDDGAATAGSSETAPLAQNAPRARDAGTEPFALLTDADVLVQADMDFDRETAAKGVEGWVASFADDGMMFPAGGEIVKGTAAIRERMTPVFATPGFSLRWKPTSGEVSHARDLGYTFGTYVSTEPGPNGEPVSHYGKYVTIWRKQADGSWKIAADIGNASPAPEAKKTE